MPENKFVSVFDMSFYIYNFKEIIYYVSKGICAQYGLLTYLQKQTAVNTQIKIIGEIKVYTVDIQLIFS